jgi:hypothetical protein
VSESVGGERRGEQKGEGRGEQRGEQRGEHWRVGESKSGGKHIKGRQEMQGKHFYLKRTANTKISTD